MPELPAVYTSLSALGADAPQSPSEGGPSGTGSGQRTALWQRTLAPYFVLLHPSAGVTAAATAASASSSNPNALGAADERTPLLRNTAATTNPAASSAISTGKYVGGGCVCSPFARRPPTNADGLATDHGRDGGVGSSGCCGASAQPCFSFGQSATQHPIDADAKAPSGMTLAAVAQTCYALMSLLAATLAKKSKDRALLPAVSLNGVQMLVWQGGSTAIVCAIVLLAVNRTGIADALLGPQGSRSWMWARAACCAATSALFVVAAHGLPMSDLVTIVYLAPLIHNMASHLVFSSRHPFRSQLVSLSLWLGVVLMTQPVLLLGGDDEHDDEAVAAAPLDLPAWTGGGPLVVGAAWAYGAAAAATVMTVLSMALLDHRPPRVSAYHSMFSSGALCVVAGLAIETWTGAAAGAGGPVSSKSSFDATTTAIVFATLFFGWWARFWQDLALFQTGSCQLSLVSFLQPLLSTGAGLLVPGVAADVAALAGCLLVLVNLAWIASPLDEEEAQVYGAGSATRG